MNSPGAYDCQAGSSRQGELSACVVNYNGEAYLGKTLSALMAQRHLVSEVLFVDNASSDGSVALAEQRFPGVEIIRLSANRGPGAARNAALALSASDRLLFLDNDIEIAAGCIEQLERALDEHPAAVLAMPSVRHASKKDLVQFEGAGCHFLGLMQLHRPDTAPNLRAGGPQPVNSLVTACFMMDLRRYSGTPRFDESFFFNLEDHDFGIRTRLKGHEILKVPAAVCYHREGTPGLSFRWNRTYPQERVIYLIRNRWRVILKNYHWKTLAILLPIMLTYEVFQFAGVLRKGWLWHWAAGLRWVICHLRELIYSRREIQADRRVPDRDILSGGPLPITGAVATSGIEKKALDTLGRLANAYWKWVVGLL